MNRLAKEKSPYLLQHAHNPVDWYPWGEEAFEKARKEDKPILLSIGYSTCHWCHVMEEESFENAETAKLMNEYFVPVKVDREERPDIDSVYMSYVMAATGSGGWPMTVFLMTDKRPFYGGTYFPPADRYGMPGFPSVLRSITDSWKERREEIARSADSAVSFLNKAAVPGAPAELSATTIAEAALRFSRAFDETFAGFGSAPKFPRSHTLSLLLRHWMRSREAQSLEIVEKTLKAMARGGMYDQLGGGFHRYSTDAQWRIPHFEKMLYDQALLVITYAEAYQATRDPFYARITRETLDYVATRMTDTGGGFYSAEDADSLDPDVPGKKREGAYFVWKKSEIEKLLPKKDAQELITYYGVEETGNALSDPHNEFKGYNALHVADGSKQEPASLEKSKKILLAARASRPAPYLDDKVLADWNGLMIAAFAQAAVALDEPRYAAIAQKAAGFTRSRMSDGKGGLWHRYRDGEAGIEANLNDYAFMIVGILRLYEATFDAAWITEAKKLADTMLEKFWDGASGGFYLTAENAEKLILRPKEVYDGAVPSGNSMAALSLLLLGRFTGEAKYEDHSRKTFEAFSASLAQDPPNYPQMLMALDFSIGPSSELVFEGASADPVLAAMRREVSARFIPNKIVLFKPNSGKAKATVCRGKTCQLPVTDAKDLLKMLESNGDSR